MEHVVVGNRGENLSTKAPQVETTVSIPPFGTPDNFTKLCAAIMTSPTSSRGSLSLRIEVAPELAPREFPNLDSHFSRSNFEQAANLIANTPRLGSLRDLYVYGRGVYFHDKAPPSGFTNRDVGELIGLLRG